MTDRYDDLKRRASALMRDHSLMGETVQVKARALSEHIARRYGKFKIAQIGLQPRMVGEFSRWTRPYTGSRNASALQRCVGEVWRGQKTEGVEDRINASLEPRISPFSRKGCPVFSSVPAASKGALRAIRPPRLGLRSAPRHRQVPAGYG